MAWELTSSLDKLLQQVPHTNKVEEVKNVSKPKIIVLTIIGRKVKQKLVIFACKG